MHSIKTLFIACVLLAAQSAGLWHAYSHLEAQLTRHEYEHSDNGHQLWSHEYSNTSDELNTVLCEMLDHLGGPAALQSIPYVILKLANFLKLAYHYATYVVPHTVHFFSTGPPVKTEFLRF
jgi:hypothetical protein